MQLTLSSAGASVGRGDLFILQVSETGEIGIRAGRFNYPTDAAVLADNSLVVEDGYNNRIQKFSPKTRP